MSAFQTALSSSQRAVLKPARTTAKSNKAVFHKPLNGAGINNLRMVQVNATGGIWSHVQQAPPDAILGVTEAWRKDTDEKKLNLGVGAYRTEEGKPLVLNAVRKAEAKVVNDPAGNKEYLGIAGNPDFCRLSKALAFGENSAAVKENRIVTVQALSGTGALRVGSEFIARHYPNKQIFIPTPTWGNHRATFLASGLEVKQYRYYKPETRGLDLEGLLADLSAAPEGAVVLLHACAHNPTGVDPTMDDWVKIHEVIKTKKLLPFFDSAYQGFASGDLDEDAAALRYFAESGMEMILAQSYAKNMGLYGERIGALYLVCADAEVTPKVQSQLNLVIRPMYSSPPRHGAAIVAAVLSDPQLYAEWKVELKAMADRIKAMRLQLHAELIKVGAPGNWDHILNQIGMFSFTGLTKPQVENMTKKWHVYMTMDGRISMAGLSGSKCAYLAEAIDDSIRNH